MDAERWRVIEDVLAAALDLEGKEREALLERRCTDEDLRAEVESLLAASEEASGFFDELAEQAAEVTLGETKPSDGPRLPDLSGTRVGAHVLVRLLGRGGMGTVYLAERSDGQFEKRVAIKMLATTTASEDAHRRFLAERAMLARLEHVNIARLLDGGVTEEGTPYIVMEHVEGLQLDEHCDEHGLELEQRLELFLDVCDAVSHAHRNLIVHRDLKPGNILVGEGGVKLLDFGIAKLLGDDTGMTITRTAGAFIPMTPAYASPEQVRGEHVTIASDVHALGVVLYKILAGFMPRDLNGLQGGALVQALCDAPILAPSVRVQAGMEVDMKSAESEELRRIAALRGLTPAGLHRGLRGDLDNIVLKALRREPERRYHSVARLSDDIRSHLTGFPVRARKETWSYRMSRFLKRHALAVSLTAFAGILLVALAGVAGWFAYSSAKQSLRIAEGEQRGAEMLSFLTELYEIADPNEGGGEAKTAKAILDRAVARLEANPGGHPETRAALLLVAGRVYRKLHLDASALPLLEEALELRRGFGEAPNDALSESLYELGIVTSRLGDAQRALSLLQQAHDQSLALHGEVHGDVARARYAMGKVQHDSGRYGPAKADFLAAVSAFKKLAPETSQEHAESLQTLGQFVAVTGDLLGAMELLEQSLAISRELGGKSNRTAIANSVSALGMLNFNIGEFELCREQLLEGVELLREVHAERAHGDLASALQNAGGVLSKLGDPEGIGLLREAIDVNSRLEPPNTLSMGMCFMYLGSGHVELGQNEQAAEAFEESIRLLSAPTFPAMLAADAKRRFGGLLLAEGKRDQAVGVLNSALEDYAGLSDEHPRKAELILALEEAQGS